MRILLWSYDDPEPTGIGPLAGVVSRSLAARGHLVEVVAAHRIIRSRVGVTASGRIAIHERAYRFFGFRFGPAAAQRRIGFGKR